MAGQDQSWDRKFESVSKAGDLAKPPGRSNLTPTCSHWGNYLIETDAGVITAVHPYEEDPNPSPIGQSLLNAMDKEVRIPQPMVRAGYLKDEWNSDSSKRGIEPFVPVSWEKATELGKIPRLMPVVWAHIRHGVSYW